MSLNHSVYELHMVADFLSKNNGSEQQWDAWAYRIRRELSTDEQNMLIANIVLPRHLHADMSIQKKENEPLSDTSRVFDINSSVTNCHYDKNGFIYGKKALHKTFFGECTWVDVVIAKRNCRAHFLDGRDGYHIICGCHVLNAINSIRHTAKIWYERLLVEQISKMACGKTGLTVGNHKQTTLFLKKFNLDGMTWQSEYLVFNDREMWFVDGGDISN